MHKKSLVFAYVELFASDDEGSDCEAESDSSSDGNDESYDVTSHHHVTPVFDKQKGEDNWVGHRIMKTFVEHGDF